MENIHLEKLDRPRCTESGPSVSENWYLSYDGPAPIVEGIYEENYGVDRGDGSSVNLVD